MTDEDESFFDFSSLKNELGEGVENWEEKLLETKSQDSNKETSSSSGNDVDIHQNVSSREQKIPPDEASAIFRGDATSFFNDSTAIRQSKDDTSRCHDLRLEGLILNDESSTWTSMMETQKQLQQQEQHRDVNAEMVQTLFHGALGSESRVDNTGNPATAVLSTPPRHLDAALGNDAQAQQQQKKKDVLYDLFASPSRVSRKKPPKRKAARRDVVDPDRDLEDDLSGSLNFTPDVKKGKFSESGKTEDQLAGGDSVVPNDANYNVARADLEPRVVEEEAVSNISNMLYDTPTVKSPLEQLVSHYKFNALLAGSHGVKTSTPVRAIQGSVHRNRFNLAKTVAEDEEQPATGNSLRLLDISAVPDSAVASGKNDGDCTKNKIDDTDDRGCAASHSTTIRPKQFVYPSRSQVQVGMCEYRRNSLMEGNPDVFDIPMSSVRGWNAEQLNKLTLYANLKTEDFSNVANVPDKPGSEDRSSPSDRKDPDDSHFFDDLSSSQLFRGSEPNGNKKPTPDDVQSSRRPETFKKRTHQLVGDREEFAKENFSESVCANPVESFQTFQLASGKGIHISSSAKAIAEKLMLDSLGDLACPIVPREEFAKENFSESVSANLVSFQTFQLASGKGVHISSGAKARAEKLMLDSLGDLACPIVPGNVEADTVLVKDRRELYNCRRNFERKCDNSSNVISKNAMTLDENTRNNAGSACTLPSSSYYSYSNLLRVPRATKVAEGSLEPPESSIPNDPIEGFLSKNVDLTESQILEVKSSSAIMLQQDEIFSSQCYASSDVFARRPDVSELSPPDGVPKIEDVKCVVVVCDEESGSRNVAKVPNSGADVDTKSLVTSHKTMFSAERLDATGPCDLSTTMRDRNTLDEATSCKRQEPREVAVDVLSGGRDSRPILETEKNFVVSPRSSCIAPPVISSRSTCHAPPVNEHPPHFVGFKTASGQKVNLNSNAIEKAKKLLGDELPCSRSAGQDAAFEFKTADGGAEKITDSNPAKEVRDAFDANAGHGAAESRQNDLTSSEEYFINMDNKQFDVSDSRTEGAALSGRAGGFSGFGFTTAGGNKIKVNQESLEKVKEMFSDDNRLGVASPIENDLVVGKMQEVGVDSAVGKKFPVFQTAKGKPVHATEEAVARVKMLFNEEGLDVSAKKEFKVSKNNVGAGKLEGNVSNDAILGSVGLGFRPPVKRVLECPPPTRSREDVRDSFAVQLESERRNQKLLIASKLKSKSHSHQMFGSLMIAKTSEANKSKRSNIKDAVQGKRPASHSIEDLLDNGVLPSCVQVTSSTAESHRFDIFDTSETDAIRPILVTDGGVIIPDDAGKIGKNEFHLALLAAPGVSPSLIDESWTYNHFRWIVWKLASMEVAFPFEFGGRCLTVDVVFSQLKYRYDTEVALSRRSALKKICERDDTSKKGLVLCVSGIDSTACGKNNLRLHLTDGWYSLPAIVDESLRSLVISKKINVGTKLVTFGSELAGSDEACPPLSAPQSLALKIHGNSTRRAAWFSKLGFVYSPLPRLSLTSLRQDGGQIACLDLLVLRVYSLLYHEKYPDGGQGTVRSERLEKKFANDFESTRQAALEKFYEKFEKEFRSKSSKNSRVDDGGDDDGCRSPANPRWGSDAESMNSFLAAKMQAESSKFPKRNVTPLLKVKVASCHKKDLPSKCATILTIWNPTEEVMDLAKEGTRFLAVNLSPSREKFYDVLTLNANKMTRYKKLNADVDFLRGVHVPRAVTSFSEVAEEDGLTECDVVAAVLKVSNGSFLQKPFSGLSETVFMVDAAGGFGAVLFLGGLCAHGLENVMKTGTLVACCNLKPLKVFASSNTSDKSSSFSSYFDRSQFRTSVAALKTDATSDFFCRPQLSYLTEALESMTAKVNCNKNFLEESLKELEIVLESYERKSVAPVFKRTENKSADVRKKMIGVARNAVAAMPMNMTLGGQLQSMFEQDDELLSNIRLSQNKSALTHARPSGLKKRCSDGNFLQPIPKRKKLDQDSCGPFLRAEKERDDLQDFDEDRKDDKILNGIEESLIKPDPAREKTTHICSESLLPTKKEVTLDAVVVVNPDSQNTQANRADDKLPEDYSWDSEFF